MNWSGLSTNLIRKLREIDILISADNYRRKSHIMHQSPQINNMDGGNLSTYSLQITE